VHRHIADCTLTLHVPTHCKNIEIYVYFFKLCVDDFWYTYWNLSTYVYEYK